MILNVMMETPDGSITTGMARIFPDSTTTQDQIADAVRSQFKSGMKLIAGHSHDLDTPIFFNEHK